MADLDLDKYLNAKKVAIINPQYYVASLSEEVYKREHILSFVYYEDLEEYQRVFLGKEIPNDFSFNDLVYNYFDILLVWGEYISPEEVLKNINEKSLLQEVIERNKKSIRDKINDRSSLIEDLTIDTIITFSHYEFEEKLLNIVFDEYKAKGWGIEVEKAINFFKSKMQLL